MNRILVALSLRSATVRDRERGFTLIELLVVVIIIGILAAIAIPVYIGVQNNARESAVRSDLGNLKTAEVANYIKSTAYVTGTDFSGLAKQGYTQSDPSNYRSGSTAPKFYPSSATTGGFCIMAVASTSVSFAVTDTTSLTKGSCATDGSFSSSQATVLP